jgi:hypothetical protein
MGTERVLATQRPTISPVRCWQRAQVHGGPGAVGPPGLGDLGGGVAGPVLPGDPGIQPGFVPGQAIRCICAAQHNQPGGGRPQSVNLLHALDGLTGIERPQRRAIRQPVEGSPGDRPEILALAAGKAQVEPVVIPQDSLDGALADLSG